jgi:hypothetical protein
MIALIVCSVGGVFDIKHYHSFGYINYWSTLTSMMTLIYFNIDIVFFDGMMRVVGWFVDGGDEEFYTVFV